MIWPSLSDSVLYTVSSRVPVLDAASRLTPDVELNMCNSNLRKVSSADTSSVPDEIDNEDSFLSDLFLYLKVLFSVT